MPGAQFAVADSVKIQDYLLSTTHAVGQTKARFFARLGFKASKWEELQAQLLALALSADADLPSRRALDRSTTSVVSFGAPLAAWVVSKPSGSFVTVNTDRDSSPQFR